MLLLLLLLPIIMIIITIILINIINMFTRWGRDTKAVLPRAQAPSTAPSRL